MFKDAIKDTLHKTGALEKNVKTATMMAESLATTAGRSSEGVGKNGRRPNDEL